MRNENDKKREEKKLRLKIYQFLVNKHPGITERYHKFHDGSSGVKKYLSWVYLLGLNICYYFFFCHFLGKKQNLAIYEEKKVSLLCSESVQVQKEYGITVEKFVETLLKYETISFDIFDTLIFRPFSEPTDLFYLLGNMLGIMDFKRIRMEMEYRARQKRFQRYHDYEVTLLEIWELMEKETGILAKVGMEAELQLELQYCYANPFMQKVFIELQKRKKSIVVVSDMYLSETFLRELLEQKGYVGIEHVYVSSEYRKSKASGELFAFVVKECQLSDLRIHVGDNVHSDVKMAKKYGFASCYYPNINKDSKQYRAHDMSPIVGGAYRGIVNNYLRNGLYTHSMEYEYGFVYGGLFVVGYCAFIHAYCEKNGIDKILFLSRDGEILKKVYKKMYPTEHTEYVFWSRRAATKLLAVCDKYDFYRRFLYHKVNQNISIKKILCSADLGELTEELNPALKNAKLTSENVEQLKAFLEVRWQKILEIYEAEHVLASSYFARVLKDCKTAVAVDIGWAGSGAMALRTLAEQVWKIPCEIRGMIAGTNTIHNFEPDASETFLQSGKLIPYLYSASHNRDIWKKHDPNKNYNVYWELLLSSPTPQFRGFGKEKFGECDENPEGIYRIRKGILDFAEEYLKHFSNVPYMLQISGRDAYAPFLAVTADNEKYLKEIEKKFHLEMNVS